MHTCYFSSVVKLWPVDVSIEQEVWSYNMLSGLSASLDPAWQVMYRSKTFKLVVHQAGSLQIAS